MQEICHETRKAYIILIDICHREAVRIKLSVESVSFVRHDVGAYTVEVIRYIWEGNGISGSWVTWTLSCRRPSFQPFLTGVQ
jgi:hypothetical protein